MRLITFVLFFCLFCQAQQSPKLGNDSSPLGEPAHLLSIVVIQVGNTFTQAQIEEQILQLNRMLDYPRVRGYQPLRLKMDFYQAFSLEELNTLLKKQCETSEKITLEQLKAGELTVLRSLRATRFPKSLTVYCYSGEVNESFREQSLEPLSAHSKADPQSPLSAVSEDYEGDYLVIASNWTLARSFGRYLALPNAWDESGNQGNSLEDVGAQGKWEKGKVDARKDRDNAMDSGTSPAYFTLSQLKYLYNRFLDRQSLDFPLAEEKGKAFLLDAEDLHELGRKYVENEDYDTALRYFEQSAQLGNSKSYFGIAYLHENRLCDSPEMSVALDWYKKAADAGLKDAQTRLGSLYEYGVGKLLPANMESAQKYWKMAAAQGDTLAKEKLEIYQGIKPIPENQVGRYYSKGMHAYYDGDGVTAFKSFYACALHQHAPSVYFLGLCYYEGKGVPQNVLESRKLWESLPEDDKALYGLGLIYFYGDEKVEQDRETAYDYFSKAAHLGHTGAQKMLKEFE